MSGMVIPDSQGEDRGGPSNTAAHDADESMTPRPGAFAGAAGAAGAQPEIPPPSVPITQTRVWLSMNIENASVNEIVVHNNLEVLAAQLTHVMAQNEVIIRNQVKAQRRRSSLSDLSASVVAGEDDAVEAGGSQEEMVQQMDTQKKIQSNPYGDEMKERYDAFVNESGKARRKYTTLTDGARAAAAEFHQRLLEEVEDAGLLELLKLATVTTFQKIYKELGVTHPENLAKKANRANKTKQRGKAKKTTDDDEDITDPAVTDSDVETPTRRRNTRSVAKGKSVQTATESQNTIVSYNDNMGDEHGPNENSDGEFEFE